MQRLPRSTSSSTLMENSRFPEEITCLPYFHPEISNMQQVFNLVKLYVNKDGHFLLRRSFSKPDTLTVSVVHSRGVKHFNIASANGEYFLKDYQLFKSVQDLISYYKTHEVPNVEGISNIRLQTPLSRWQALESQATVGTTTGTKDSKKNTFLYEKLMQKMSSDATGSVQADAIGSVRANATGSLRAAAKLPVRTKGVQSRALLDCDDSIEMRDSPLQGRKVRSSSLGERKLASSPNYLSTLSALKSLTLCPDRPSPATPLDKSSFKKQTVSGLPPVKCPRINELYLQLESNTCPYYSTVQNLYAEKAPELIRILRNLEGEEESDRCICGLLLDEAELALGWTMHLSTEPETAGKLFFMGPEGETAWNLPLEVSLNLSADQQEKIQYLLRQINVQR